MLNRTKSQMTALGTLKRFSASLFVTLLALSSLSAGVLVSPTYLIVSSPSRSCALTVTNATDKDREVWLEFSYGYQSVDNQGTPHIVVVPTDSGGDRSAARWLRGYPSRFLLPQNTSQTVRIMVTPPAGTSDGEYWARVVVGSKEAQPIIVKNAVRQAEGVRTAVGIIEHKDLPFHYRRGIVSPRITLRNLTTEFLKDTVKVSLDVQRSGNAAFWGTATFRLMDRYGTVVSTLRKGIALYKDEILPFFLPVVKVAAGEYSLDVALTTDAKGISREQLLQIEPIKYSTRITLP